MLEPAGGNSQLQVSKNTPPNNCAPSASPKRYLNFTASNFAKTGSFRLRSGDGHARREWGGGLEPHSTPGLVLESGRVRGRWVGQLPLVLQVSQLSHGSQFLFATFHFSQHRARRWMVHGWDESEVGRAREEGGGGGGCTGTQQSLFAAHSDNCDGNTLNK